MPLTVGFGLRPARMVRPGLPVNWVRRTLRVVEARRVSHPLVSPAQLWPERPPVYWTCVHHDQGGSPVILWSPPTGGRLVMMSHLQPRTVRRARRTGVGNVQQNRATAHPTAVCDRWSIAGGGLSSPVFGVMRIAANRLPEFLPGAGRVSPEDFGHVARVLLCAAAGAENWSRGEANTLAAAGPGLLCRLVRPRD